MEIRTMFWGFCFACLLGTVSAQTTTKYDHRGYLGWLVDLSHTVIDEPWPSVALDDALVREYEETLNFMQQTGMTEITPWGFFTNEHWDTVIEQTISDKRKRRVTRMIEMAHARGIKVLCGMGVYSWGFGLIMDANESLRCPCNPRVMDMRNPDAWHWQKKVLDYIMDNFEFDGFSLQSADKGACNCDTTVITDPDYHARLNQKTVNYIRSKKPRYIIGIAGWGMDLRYPKDLSSWKKMTRNVDYLIDVGESASLLDTNHQEKVINAIAPCAYGSTATPNIEPIQGLPRDHYFVPTIYHTCARLKQLHIKGARACEAYMRTRGNPGDKVTVEVVGRFLSNVEIDLDSVLLGVIREMFHPASMSVLTELVEIFKIAENAFFDLRPKSNNNGQYYDVIELMPRKQRVPTLTYFASFTAHSRETYHAIMKSLLHRAEKLKDGVRQDVEFNRLVSSLRNTLEQLERYR